MNILRIYRLIQNAIATFSLDLRGLSVLTEAATGYYMLTPLLAGLAGADHVYAITRDSKFGQAVTIKKQTVELAKTWGVDNRIEILFDRDDELIGRADIVTNLGFVRPIDKEFLNRLKSTAVIPLMWETWEYRKEDLDLIGARRLGIPVLGTNEHHHALGTLEYLGHVAMKLLLEVEIEIYRSSIIILGSGEFAQNTASTLQAVGAHVFFLESTEPSQWSTEAVLQAITKADAILVVDLINTVELVGPNGLITGEQLLSHNPSVAVVHICGQVDYAALVKLGVRCWPKNFAKPRYMSAGTQYVGPKPLIDLHSAGLKVGEAMARLRLRGLQSYETEITVLKELDIAQGFQGYHPVF